MKEWFTVEATLDNGDVQIWHICTISKSAAAGKVASYIDNSIYAGIGIRALRVRKENYR